MNYSDMDPDLTTWGVASESADGRLQVRAYRSYSAAEKAAKDMPRLTIEGKHPTTGAHHTIPDVWPLAYHHPEQGWTLAAIGWPVPTPAIR